MLPYSRCDFDFYGDLYQGQILLKNNIGIASLYVLFQFMTITYYGQKYVQVC